MTTKPRLSYRSVLVGLATLVLVCTVGYVAYETGVKKGVQEAFFCNALHAQNYASALRALRTGDSEQGLKMLEVSMDASVLLMAPDNDVLESRTEKSVNEVLLDVKKYRTAYPRSRTGNSEAMSRVDGILSSAAKAK